MEVSLYAQFSTLLTPNGSKQLNGNWSVRHVREVCGSGFSAWGACVARRWSPHPAQGTRPTAC